MQELIPEIERWVDDILESQPEYFKTEIKIKPVNNIKVYVDGDKGISIEKCIEFNRALYKRIENSGLFEDGNFSLEVSSPGVDTPLRYTRQFKKNIGRKIEVTLNDDSKKQGTLVNVAEEDIVLDEVSGKGSKAIHQQIVIPFSNIKKSVVQIQF